MRRARSIHGGGSGKRVLGQRLGDERDNPEGYRSDTRNGVLAAPHQKALLRDSRDLGPRHRTHLRTATGGFEERHALTARLATSAVCRRPRREVSPIEAGVKNKRSVIVRFLE